jgi:PIN domain nuclease of toxin-antitoxin system
MAYLLDTVTIIRHFTNTGKIGKAARQILNEIEINREMAVVSIISLMEILYLAERNRIEITFEETLEEIEKSSNYFIIDLTPEILQTALHINFPELHDRLILATAKYLNIPILSGDRQFQELTGIPVVWK